jgi:DnaK suppressor protein
MVMKTRSTGKAASSRRRPKATTSEVISTFTEDQVPPKWRMHYRRLIELRSDLLETKGDLKSDADNSSPRYSLHMADAATDNYDRDFAFSMLSSEQNAIYEIEQALNRIQQGTYGICVSTGKPISSDRLNAIPWTRFSADVEKDLEEKGEVTQAKLGDLARVPKESTEKAAKELEKPAEEIE